MRFKILVLPLAFAMLGLSGCTAKYQDLLRDRDAQIRELNGMLAELRATNADLQAREKAAREAAAVAPEPVNNDELERVQTELDGLDVRYNGGRLSIGIENTVTFSSGSAKLKESAGEILRRVATVLNRDFSGRRIYVEGHTDTDPIVKTKSLYRSNRHLSAERADVVADYLVRKGGVDPAIVVVVGYGQYEPKDMGSGDVAKSHNRRVEIVVGDAM